MSEATEQTHSCFKLKGSLFTLSVLYLYNSDIEAFNEHLQETIAKAPNFFHYTPMVLDLSKLPSDQSVDFPAIAQCLRENHIIPVGVCNASEDLLAEAKAAGLAPMSNVSPSDNKTEPSSKTNEFATTNTTKIITDPVRSGQQIYSKGDLIVTGSVSNGAELLAHGHIHVYGTLRGRALAGISGNNQARIFCRDMDAEMVSIGGLYVLKSDDKRQLRCQNANVYLEGESLLIA